MFPVQNMQPLSILPGSPPNKERKNRYETPGNSIQMVMFSPAVRLQSFPFLHNTMRSRHVIYLHFTPLCRSACETPLKESDECYKQAKLYMP